MAVKEATSSALVTGTHCPVQPATLQPPFTPIPHTGSSPYSGQGDCRKTTWANNVYSRNNGSEKKKSIPLIADSTGDKCYEMSRRHAHCVSQNHQKKWKAHVNGKACRVHGVEKWIMLWDRNTPEIGLQWSLQNPGWQHLTGWS